jgi:ATP/maltotriose-dependent transcriptional regulator MalT
LAASISWSHDLLTDADRVVFRRLSVFTGGFTLDAANAVCGEDVRAMLARLVDKSLVQPGTGYRLLESVRQYAADQLFAAGETAAIRNRHLDYFLALAMQAEDGLERDQDRWRQLLDNDADNLRAALRWGLDLPDPDRGRRLAAVLVRYWFIRGHAREGLAFLRRAAERAPDDTSALQASLYAGIAMVAIVGGRRDLIIEYTNRCFKIASDSPSRGRALIAAGYDAFYFDFAECERLTVQAQQETGDDAFTADFGMLLRACSLTNRDRHAEAVALIKVMFERSMPRGDRFCAAFACGVQLWAALFTGDLRHADALGTQAVEIAEPLDDYFTVGTNTTNLAWVRSLAGDIDGGLALMATVFRSFTDAGGQDVDVVSMVVILAKLHLWSGDLESAVQWAERGSRFGAPETANWVAVRSLPVLAEALRRLGRTDEARVHAERAVALARKLDVPHVHAEGLQELAFLAGDDALDLHHDALAIRVEAGLRTFVVDSLEAIAGHTGPTEAAHLLGACDSAREVIGYRRTPVAQPDYEAIASATRDALGEGFAGAYTDGLGVSLDDAVRYARRARGTRGRPATGWDSLTPTELEVVELTVKGLTNPQIGARLFISVATVKTHLRHVYAKLGVANRTELATMAGPRLSMD